MELDVGAGVLAYSFNDGQMYILLHSTVSGKKVGYLVDCGGGTNKGESTTETAVREFAEETGGLFFPPYAITREDLAKKLSSLTTVDKFQTIPEIQSSIPSTIAHFQKQPEFTAPLTTSWFLLWKYYMYVLHVPFIDVELLNQAQTSLGNKRKQFRWVPVDQLINRKTEFPLLERVEGQFANLCELLTKLQSENKK